MAEKKLTFDEWFRSQHGPRPGGLVKDGVLETRQLAGEDAATILEWRREYDARRESALYAWQALEKTP